MLALKTDISAPCDLTLTLQFPVTLNNDIDDLTLFLSLTEPPIIEVQIDFMKYENIEIKINTFCGIEQLGTSLKNSILSCIHTIIQEYVYFFLF